MTDPSSAAHRSLYDPRPDEVSLRDSEEMESPDGMMEIRLPIASTGQVRNEGDEPLTREVLGGMADQVDTLTRGVFPEHGKSSAIDNGRYSQFEKLGYWADADVQNRASADGEDLLMATARMPDPETLPQATGKYREGLAILKEQAKRGIPISASIGWSDDENQPGGVDLLEASIVGIGADARTTTEGGTEALARAAVEAGADPDELVRQVARAVGTDAADSLETTHDMSDTDDDTETPDEQTADTDTTDGDGETETETETTERAPEDVSENDLLTFTAMHFDGMDEEDMAQAVDAADASYIGECDPEALANLVSEATGAEYETVVEAMDALMSDPEADDEQGDYGDDEEDDENDEEMNADTPDSEQSGDVSALEERLADLEDELAAVRSGEVDVATPDTPDGETDTETDTEEREADEQTDDDTDDDTNTRTATGPNWRAT